MNLYLGQSGLTGNIYIGNDLVSKIYLGDNIVYPNANICTNGLEGIRYIGYFNDDTSWFNTATPHGDTVCSTAINNFSSSPDFAQEEEYSWQWTGYFRASSTETYTFYTYSDDGSYLWLGLPAATNYTTETALVNNGGLHGGQEVSGSIALTSGEYYPIRIQFGEYTGGDIMTVSFSTDTITKTTDGSGYYFNSIPS